MRSSARSASAAQRRSCLLLFLHLYQRQSGVPGNDFEDRVG